MEHVGPDGFGQLQRARDVPQRVGVVAAFERNARERMKNGGLGEPVARGSNQLERLPESRLGTREFPSPPVHVSEFAPGEGGKSQARGFAEPVLCLQ